MSNMTTHERFTEVHRNSLQSVSGQNYILKDNETGVLYYMICTRHGDGVALTPLLDVDGKPIINK